MALIVLSALALSLVIYIAIGFIHKKSVFGLGDIIPIMKGKNAQVKGNAEITNTRN